MRKTSKEISPERLSEQQNFIEKIRNENAFLAAKPRACIKTYGCAQNENDSERIKGMLFDMGYEFCEETADADLVVLNTCMVRENAEMKVFGNLGILKHQKEKNPSMLIAVCGCMAQQAHIAEEIRKKYKQVDMVFGTHSLYKFPEILDEARRGSRAILNEESDGEIAEGITLYREAPPIAKISVMYGCNNFCTYCVVPYVRGRERSRSVENILAEVKNASEDGYKEVMLLGQNVNSYGKDLESGIDFAELLSLVCKVDGIERVRFMTSHPKDISERLIEVMATEPKICKQLHLPVQCGSDKILKAMNRSYSREKYLDIVRRVREKMPDVVLTTDIIVGFPGENNEDFEDTLSILREAEYDMVFSFIYSRRKGTPAAELPDCITEEEKHTNFEKLLEVQNEISKKKNDAYLGRMEKVLVESVSKTNGEFLSGRTDGGKIVNFRGDEALIGSIVDVKITECKTWSLTGEIIK